MTYEFTRSPTRAPRTDLERNLLLAIEVASHKVKADMALAEAASARADIASLTAERDMLARRLAALSKGDRS